MFVTAEGRPLTRFRRAVEHHDLFGAEAAAREFGRRLDLSDALGLLELIAEREPHRYERAAVRWHGRLELERLGLTLAEAQLALTALGVLPANPEQALPLLREIERPRRRTGS
jgi:hypothetical protein